MAARCRRGSGDDNSESGDDGDESGRESGDEEDEVGWVVVVRVRDGCGWSGSVFV